MGPHNENAALSVCVESGMAIAVDYAKSASARKKIVKGPVYGEKKKGMLLNRIAIASDRELDLDNTKAPLLLMMMMLKIHEARLVRDEREREGERAASASSQDYLVLTCHRGLLKICHFEQD